jgi:hypothetical protein
LDGNVSSGNVREVKMVKVVRIGGMVFAQTMIGRDVVIAFAEMFSRGSGAAAQRVCIGPSIGRWNRESIREP